MRAGVSNFHFHDLRHEATSRLCESGKLSQMHIMNMTGHSSMTTFQGYVHLMNHETTPVLD
ncbi:tyrosine-type recombinase/integrase [Hydrogenophaga atypica]|uniref:Tyrosine-type recombinase/integrase n=1 Tax=Hydrogenophaga atypica TaxID=249409 RepID=A0ABW2QJ46_9BURK